MVTKAALLAGLSAALALAPPAFARDGRRRRPRRKEPKVGQAAPDFELVKLGEKGRKDGKVKLSEQWARKPLVLIFSSYT